jgi:hypothetical protein
LPNVIGEITLKVMRAKGNAHWTELSIGELILAGLFVLLLLVLAILLSPIIVPYLFYLYIRSKIENREFEKYIRSSEGAKFFIYTARRTSESWVKENVLPLLPPDTRIIYLGDSRRKPINLGDDQPFLEQFIYRVRGTPGSYPYVAKISKGKLVSISVNRQLYSAITRKADADGVNKTIAKFLER